MLYSIINGEPESITKSAPLGMLLAFPALFLIARCEMPGILSCVQILALSASAATLVEYRTEHGLWMLAAFLCVFFVAIYGLCLLGEIMDPNRGNSPLSLVVDAAISMSVLQTHIRFLWKTARLNCQLPRA